MLRLRPGNGRPWTGVAASGPGRAGCGALRAAVACRVLGRARGSSVGRGHWASVEGNGPCVGERGEGGELGRTRERERGEGAGPRWAGCWVGHWAEMVWGLGSFSNFFSFLNLILIQTQGK